MKDRKLATRYARALLSVLEPTAAEEADRFLDSLREAIEESADTRDFLLDPAVTREARVGALRSLADKQGLPRLVGNFLATLVDHNRTAALPSIARVFHEERERLAGVVPAEITSAAPLSPELEARARRALERVTGRRVRLSCQVDPALLGGAVTRVGSTVYDGSLRTQLARLGRKMAQE